MRVGPAVVALLLASTAVFADPPVARLNAVPLGGLEEAGLAEPSGAAVEREQGPCDGVDGFRPIAPQRWGLSRPISGAGTLAFWFHLDRAYRNGAGVKAQRSVLLRVPELFDVTLAGEANAQTLTVAWRAGGKRAENDIPIIVPELPGPAWYHFAVAWDGRGRMGAWLDGTAFFLPGGRIPPWRPGPATALQLLPKAPPIAEIRLWDRALTDEEARLLVPPSYRGRADRILGSIDLGPMPDEPQGKLLAAFPFANAADLAGWRAEGPLQTELRDGWLEMKSRRPDGPKGHTVFWCPRPLPASFAASWDFQLLKPTGLCIVFFAAHADGRPDIFDPGLHPRDGTFSQYTNGDISAYHISYYATAPWDPRGMANLRKNPGFYLLSNGPIRVTPGADRTYRATLVKRGDRIRMAIDGRLIIDYADRSGAFGAAYGGGWFGLRQMQWTDARYRNLSFYALRSEE